MVVNFTYIQVKRRSIENAYREWYKRNKVGKKKKDLELIYITRNKCCEQTSIP